MGKPTKTQQFSIVKGILEEKVENPEDAADDYQKAILAEMDRLKLTVDGTPATANDWTNALNDVEQQLAEQRARERALNATKEAIHRLISKYLVANRLTSFVMNGFRYSEEFAPVATTVDKVALVEHCLKTDQKHLLSVHSSTLNGWISNAVAEAIETLQNGPVDPALAALGVDASDTRGKEGLGTEGGREAFIALLESIVPPGVKANGRTKISRRKS
jgi:hypothetical protein